MLTAMSQGVAFGFFPVLVAREAKIVMVIDRQSAPGVLAPDDDASVFLFALAQCRVRLRDRCRRKKPNQIRRSSVNRRWPSTLQAAEPAWPELHLVERSYRRLDQ